MLRMNRRNFSKVAVIGLAAPFLILRALPAWTQEQSIEEAARSFDRLRSLIVQHGDKVLFFEALRGPPLDQPASIKSCSKSIVSLLLGTAIARGEASSVDARLATVAPTIIPSDATPGVEDITLEDLVTMRAGLAATSGPEYGAWISSDDWIGYALRQPMVGRPGGRMIYSTGSTHVLGAALTVSTGKDLLTLARTRLGAPLGIEIPPWTRDPKGFYLGGNEMALSPHAMLKIAIMMRDGGRFEGKQIVPKSWIDASTQARTRSPWSGMDYGYGWFLTETGFIVARGYGGQIIAANPSRKLAVAFTSDPDRPARSAGYFGELMRFLDGPILHAARG
ncbi:serine hydrolase [Hoeflea sp. CAU 1731]